jgi:hypothetical protein
LGTTRIPTDLWPASERFRWHGCIPGAWSSCANGRVALAPLEVVFLARGATSHACVVANANRSIRATLVAKPDVVGVSADCSRRVAYLAAWQKPAPRFARGAGPLSV